MNARARRTWIGFGAGALLGVLGLSLLTWRTLQHETEYAQAALEAQWEEDLRTALYRMDQRFAPLLASAVARTERPGISATEAKFTV